jgi:hypothetical protein
MSSELMTGYACGGPAPLSFITASSFFDLGISVASYGDDDYTVTYRGCSSARTQATEIPFEVVPVYRDESGAVLTDTDMQLRRKARLQVPGAERTAAPEQVLQRSRR